MTFHSSRKRDSEREKMGINVRIRTESSYVVCSFPLCMAVHMSRKAWGQRSKGVAFLCDFI